MIEGLPVPAQEAPAAPAKCPRPRIKAPVPPRWADWDERLHSSATVFAAVRSASSALAELESDFFARAAPAASGAPSAAQGRLSGRAILGPARTPPAPDAVSEAARAGVAGALAGDASRPVPSESAEIVERARDVLMGLAIVAMDRSDARSSLACGHLSRAFRLLNDERVPFEILFGNPAHRDFIIRARASGGGPVGIRAFYA